MRIQLTIRTQNSGSVIPINYQYPLSSALYKIIQQADSSYSTFLYDTGYGKGFKLFSFSDLEIPFRIIGDRLLLLTNTIKVTICFHLPRTAEIFIKGLFMSQQMTIADKTNSTRFIVQNVEVLHDGLENVEEEEFAISSQLTAQSSKK